jgi:hypothetical protein
MSLRHFLKVRASKWTSTPSLDSLLYEDRDPVPKSEAVKDT